MNRFCVERMYNTNADVYLDYPFPQLLLSALVGILIQIIQCKK